MKKILLVWMTVILYVTAAAQSNYSFTNTGFFTGTYTDISGTGTEITMTSTADGTNTTPIPIGFSFTFNGSAFTQCMIHSDGILRFGTAAPGSHTALVTNNGATGNTVFTTSNSIYQQVVLPLFMDLVQGSGTPAYHVLTQGVAPGRVTTIQWKNLKDNNNSGSTGQNQFENLEFQVKLYETSNDIQIVYGTFLPSSANTTTRYAQAGIKATASSFIGTKRSSSALPFAIAEFLNAPAHAIYNAGMPLRKTVVPPSGSGFIFYGQLTNDISIRDAYVERSVIKTASAPMHNKVAIKNEGTATLSSIGVTMQITGANTYSQTIPVASLAAGGEQVIDFSGYSIINTGEQSVSFTLTVADDERTANNTIMKKQTVSSGFVQALDDSLNQLSGIGFNNLANNESTLRMYATGTHKLSQIRIPFNSYLSNVSIKIIDDNGTGNSPGTVLHTSASMNTNGDNETLYNLATPVTVEGDYFISVRQNNTTNMGWQFAAQYPVHPNRVFNGNGFSYSLQPADRVFHPLIKVVEENELPDVGITAVTGAQCSYGSAVPVSVALRNYSSAVQDFAANPVTISGSVLNDVTNTPIPFSIVRNSGTLAAGASETITVLAAYDFSVRARHRITAATQMGNDAALYNDSLSYQIVNNLRITRSFTDSVCPFTNITLSIPANIYSNIQWTAGNNMGYQNDFIYAPGQTSVVRVTANDYRGCLISDSVIIPVKANDLPPSPVITFNDTLLRYRNGFSDTLSVSGLAGHSVHWMGGGTVLNGDLSYVVDGTRGVDPEAHIVYYRNLSTGCGGNGSTVTTRFSAGLLMDNNNDEILCDTSFYDQGGPMAIYSGSANFVKTFYPGTPGSKIKLSIYELMLGQFSSLRIYDGSSTSAPSLDQLGATSPNLVREYIASNNDGALTIRFTGSGNFGTGWLAGITCETPLQFRSLQNGAFTDASTWESKLPAAANYSPASRRPFKGDDTIIIRHSISLPAGTSLPLDQTTIEASGGLIIPSGSNIQLYSDFPGYQLIVDGVLTVNGSITGRPDPSTDGRLLLAGTLYLGGDINISSLTAGPATAPVSIHTTAGARISRLEINNPSGVVIHGNLNISRLLNLQNGVVTMSPSSYLSMVSGESPQLQGGSELSYINGKMRYESFSTSNPLIFPVGKNGVYRKIELLANQTSYDNYVEYEAELFTGLSPVRTLPASFSNINQQWYHTISLISGGNYFADATATIYYEASDGITDPSTLLVGKDDGGSQWTDIGGTASGSPAGSITSNSFASFSDFILANINGAPLPVTLLSFNGKLTNHAVALSWNVENEDRFAYYQVERSTDGHTFVKLGTVTAGGLTGYQYTDGQLPDAADILYYRLKLTDRDGSFKYSSIIPVKQNVALQNRAIVVTPNPFTDHLVVRYPSTNSKRVELQLLDMEGKVLKHAVRTASAGINQLYLEARGLPQGMYLLKIVTAGDVITRKVIK